MPSFKERVEIGPHVLYLGDCREILPTLTADACVTDPPYGIGESSKNHASRSNLAEAGLYESTDWDDLPPPQDVVDAAIAATKSAIIFGGNYFHLPPSSCWLVWDKENGTNDFADAELAWTNLPKAVRLLRYRWNGMLRANGEKRDGHPTQKPRGLMEWCLGFLPDAQTILDPFMGSGTTGVACAKLGRKFIGVEIHEPYFRIAVRRITDAVNGGTQPELFHA